MTTTNIALGKTSWGQVDAAVGTALVWTLKQGLAEQTATV